MVDIRPFDLQNVTLHYKWKNDDELNYYNPQNPNREESFESFLRRIKSILENKNSSARLFEIHCSESKKLIGMVDIYAIDNHNRRCYVNCVIGNPDYIDSGCEVKALGMILGYCFNELGMHKVCTTAFDFNVSWIRGVKELGFRKEGVLRDHARKNETYCNEVIFGLLAGEYEKVQNNPKLRAVN